MNSSLILLLRPEEWESYKHRSMEEKGLQADQVIWGNGPTSYPCMVAGFIMETERSPGSLFACCYVYVDQAQQLLSAAGRPTQVEGESAPTITTEIGPEQAKFNETMLAHTAAILKVLVDTSITKEEHYMPIFNGELAALEQQHAADLDERLKSVKGALKKKEKKE